MEIQPILENLIEAYGAKNRARIDSSTPGEIYIDGLDEDDDGDDELITAIREYAMQNGIAFHNEGEKKGNYYIQLIS